MSVTIKFDMSTFRAGLRHKLALSKKTEVEILNKAGRDVCLRAIKYTHKASAADISSRLKSNGLALRLVQSPAMQGRLPQKLVGFTKGTHSKAQIDAAAAKLIALRRRSVAYIKAGWIKAAQAFGAAKNSKVSNKGNAGKGYGRKATESHLVAVGVNFATGAPTVGSDPLQEGLDEVGKDLSAYAPKQIARHWT